MILHILTHGIIPKALGGVALMRFGPRALKVVARRFGSVF